jgi:hypothetical protein
MSCSHLFPRDLKKNFQDEIGTDDVINVKI